MPEQEKREVDLGPGKTASRTNDRVRVEKRAGNKIDAVHLSKEDIEKIEELLP